LPAIPAAVPGIRTSSRLFTPQLRLAEGQTVAIKFSGEFTTPRSPEEVFDFLSDPQKFAPLLPDFQSMSMQDPTHFAVRVKVGMGNIRGSAELKMELSEAVKPLRALYKGQGTAVGSQVTVSAGFDLSPLPESTRVVWQGETSVFGKLASMAGGMLEPLGRKNIQKLIDGLQKALAEPGGALTAVTSPSVASATVEAADGLQTAELPQSKTVLVAEAPGLSPANLEPALSEAIAPETLGVAEAAAPSQVEGPYAGPENTGVLQSKTDPAAEASGISPADTEHQQRASAPAQNHATEGDHGNRNP
jgi:carbon monoxide dehydrogenase subunit G